MVELTLYTPEMTWETLSFFPGSAEVKILRTEQGGARTLLLRLPPGGEISPHSHLGVVQHYVLEGNTKPRERCSAPVFIDCCPSTPTWERSRLRQERSF